MIRGNAQDLSPHRLSPYHPVLPLRRLACGVTSLALVMLTFATPAFATDLDTALTLVDQGRLSEALEPVSSSQQRSRLAFVLIPIALLSLAIGAFFILSGADQGSVDGRRTVDEQQGGLSPIPSAPETSRAAAVVDAAAGDEPRTSTAVMVPPVDAAPPASDAGNAADTSPPDVDEEPAKTSPRTAPFRQRPTPTKSYGGLTVITDPWCEVYLGGRRLGRTPFMNVKLPAGNHSLRLLPQGKGPARSVPVRIQPDRVTPLSLKLNPR
jgi:hypothetical protein